MKSNGNKLVKVNSSCQIIKNMPTIGPVWKQKGKAAWQSCQWPNPRMEPGRGWVTICRQCWGSNGRWALNQVTSITPNADSMILETNFTDYSTLPTVLTCLSPDQTCRFRSIESYSSILFSFQKYVHLKCFYINKNFHTQELYHLLSGRSLLLAHMHLIASHHSLVRQVTEMGDESPQSWSL